jgi:hypothetical protein
VTDRASTIDDKTMAFGLLMESAQAHQKLAESQLQKLRDHTRDLDGVVRDEIRRTMVDELQTLTAETSRAIHALEKIRRGAGVRTALGSLGLAVTCAIAPIAVAKLTLPSAAEVNALQAKHDELTVKVSRLEQRGGRIDLRQCGISLRLCVQVDLKAPKYGDKADYYVLEGY